MDTEKSLIKSIRRFFSGTALSRFSGLGREVIMAAAFGTTPVVASFWMAFRFAHLLRRLFGEGALNVAFVPHFEELKKKNSIEAAQFFYNLSSQITFFLLIVILLIEAILGAFSFLFQNEVITLTMIMLPSLLFICLHALNSSLLQCETKFFLSSASPFVLNSIWIVTVFFVRGKVPEKAIQLLSIVIVFGFMFQWLVTQIPAMKYLRGIPKASLNKKQIFAILRPFLLSILGVAATQINSALDSLFAKAADPEGPAVLWYAIRLQQLPLAMLGVALSSALLPAISRAVQNQDIEKYLHFINFAIKKVATFMIPITAAIFALGFVSVNLIYGRGEFGGESIKQTNYCLWAYGIALLPQTLVLILASAFYAIKDYKTPTLLCLLCVILNIALNALFVYEFHMGAISIAFATSIASAVNALLLAYCLNKKRGNFMQGVKMVFLKLTVCSTLAFLVTAGAGAFFFQDNTLFPTHNFPHGFFSQLGHFTIQGALFGISLVFFAIVLKTKEILNLLRAF